MRQREREGGSRQRERDSNSIREREKRSLAFLAHEPLCSRMHAGVQRRRRRRRNQEAKQAKQTHEAVDEEEPIERLLDVRFPLTQASMDSHVCLDEGVHRGAA